MNSLQSFWSDFLTRFRTRFPEFYAKLPALVELSRLDRPIGIYLLLWPTLGALWIAAEGIPDFSLLIIFVLGTVVMRSAGCCINDFADSGIDGRVKRTEQRPLARGALSRQDAMYCFIALSSVGFLLVLLTNRATVLLSFGAVLLIFIYPFMKRITNLPQIFLGLAFSWAVLMAFTAQTGSVPLPAYLLFIANTLWTVAYDTQYAMVDREFDLQVGVKSTAILFGDADKLVIAMLQAMFIFSMVLAGRQFELGTPFYYGLVVAVSLMIYQQFLIKDRVPARCFAAFLNNNWVGAVIFAGLLLSYI